MLKYEGVDRLLALLQPGDRVIIEYEPLSDGERVIWGEIISAMIQEGDIAVIDIYGVGDIMFRNYVRLAPSRKYRKFIEGKKHIHVFKVGPGNPSYGEIIGEEKVYSRTENFMKAYYWMMRRALSVPRRPRYLVIFGISEYLHFTGDSGLYNLLYVISSLPVEDFVTIVPLDIKAVDPKVLAVVENMASHVISLTDGSLRVLKGGSGVEDG
ncbi:hypothetical protein [Thermococcus sp. Bubb.Bath]|uniref:hypothetical protein n=1 Tax=Thermococcus sp. Bubb.Bath TaxID=1638242 RepID=UPI001438835C|nr:hypothetical protein [Thermococcus sp. Bubb.Bath]NJF24356.1 hypothetical protein [Thermococcus sp. Bubb.Bath]